MKKKLLNFMIENIKKNKKNLSEEQLEIIQYGLEAIYLTISKILIIFILAYFLNIFKEMILILIFYNIIRLFAFGLHAKNSISCLVTSLILFIGGAYLATLTIDKNIKIIFSIISLILIMKYSPADTEKRPLINALKRKKFKILSVITSLIITILIIIFNNEKISNYMFIGYIEATIMILPITYKIYGVQYNNYKNYNNIEDNN